MRGWQAVTVSFGAALLLSTTAVAGRFFGNVNLIWQRQQLSNGSSATLETSQETALLNYEDQLFFKNRLRLAANLFRQENPEVGKHDFRPIFYVDLMSYGYTINVSYSPYRQLAGTAGRYDLYYLYRRDWRSVISINYVGYPSGSIVYNSNRAFDREANRRVSGYNQTLLLECGYQLGGWNGRLTYSRLKQQTYLSTGSRSITRSLVGSAAYSRAIPKTGFLTASYSLSDARLSRGVRETTPFSQSRNHTLTAVFTSDRRYASNLNLSYSARFFSTDVRNISRDTRNHTLAAQLTFQPLRYLGADVTKFYQTSNESGSDQQIEYLTIGANATRFIRRGADLRLSASRTFYQQSARLDLNANPAGTYRLDNGFVSLGLYPFAYLRTLFDVSVLRDSDPIVSTQRYSIVRSLTAQFWLLRNLEGRAAATAIYQGATFEVNNSFSQSYNLGLSWYPEANLNVNLTYIYTSTRSSFSSKVGAFSGYAGYTFRHAFSLYCSFNRQLQENRNLPGQDVLPTETTIRPRTISAQMVLFLSRKVTLTFGYLHNQFTIANAQASRSETAQALLNLQI